MLKRIVMTLVLGMATMQVAAAHEFQLTDTNGNSHSLAAHHGKWVLLNVWATWCAPCLIEMPELEALSKARSDLVVLGVAGDIQNPRRLAQFAEKLRVTYPIIPGNSGTARQFKLRGFPTTLIFDPSGKQVLRKEGPITREEIEVMLDRRKKH